MDWNVHGQRYTKETIRKDVDRKGVSLILLRY